MSRSQRGSLVSVNVEGFGRTDLTSRPIWPNKSCCFLLFFLVGGGGERETEYGLYMSK